VDEEGAGDGSAVLAVLEAGRRIRTGQQHAHRPHEPFAALNELGISIGGPPFDCTAARATLRARVTLAVLDLRHAVTRLRG